LLIALGAYAWSRFGPATGFTPKSLSPGFELKEFIFFSLIAFAWTGPESISFMAGEVKSPRRSIPLGLAIAAPLIALIYIVGTLALLAVLKPSDVNTTSGVMQAIGSVAAHAGWLVLTPIAAVLVAVSCLGSCGAWMGSVARIPFVAGVDRYLPSAFGRLDPRSAAPVTVLLMQGLVAAILVVLGQSGASVRSAYELLVASTIVGTLIPFLFLFASAMKLYVESPSPDVVRIPGGKPVLFAAAIVGLLTTGASIVFAVFPSGDEPNKPLAVVKLVVLTVLLVGAGAAVYLNGKRRQVEDDRQAA
jgi:amino acid transporter